MIKDDFIYQRCEANGREFKYLYQWQKDLIKHLSKDKKILEVGCGRGSFERFMPNIFGIEYNKLYVKEADLPNVIIGNAFDLSKFYDKYDIVFSTGMIEHYETKEMANLLEEQFKCLKEGGKAVVVVPRVCFEAKINRFEGQNDKLLGRRMDATSVISLMRNVGFKGIVASPIGIPFRSNIKLYHNNFSQLFWNCLFYPLKFKIKGYGNNLLVVGYK